MKQEGKGSEKEKKSEDQGKYEKKTPHNLWKFPFGQNLYDESKNEIHDFEISHDNFSQYFNKVSVQ